jgi:5-methylcytosine-specific restriction endonuclease McrA
MPKRTSPERNAIRAQRIAFRECWNTNKWRRIRLEVIARDGGQCVLCGSSERLTADHYPVPVIALLETGGDPFDADGCRTLCGSCSGCEDGKRQGKRAVEFLRVKTVYPAHLGLRGVYASGFSDRAS